MLFALASGLSDALPPSCDNVSHVRQAIYGLIFSPFLGGLTCLILSMNGFVYDVTSYFIDPCCV